MNSSRWAAAYRWWGGKLYWRFTFSYFLATLLAIFISEFAGRYEGPFAVFRGSWLAETFTRFFDNSINSGFLVAAVAAFIGAFAGLLITGNVTKRLRHITQAAQAWSQGEFAAIIHDASNDELGQLAHDLNAMAGQLQTLISTRQALAVVEERHRLARDLHDSVKQQVFANALLVRAARKLVTRDPDKTAGYLEEAEALAEATQQELIALIHALRPAAIADKGLVETLQAYSDDWARRMGIAVALHITGAQTTPLAVEEALYRVAEEALANVARHSGAAMVDLYLTWNETQLCLSIHDDGKGFDKAQVAGKGLNGVGLTNMRERIELVGGTLCITSNDEGTSVEATVPLDTSNAAYRAPASSAPLEKSYDLYDAYN